MTTWKLSGQLNVAFSDLEIIANSEEEALEKLYRMDVIDIVSDSSIDESDIIHEEAKLENYKFRFKVSNIDWIVSEEELEENGTTEEEVIDSLPKEYFFTVLYDPDYIGSIYDIEGDLRDQLAAESGYYFSDFKYEVCPDDEEMLEYLKERVF